MNSALTWQPAQHRWASPLNLPSTPHCSYLQMHLVWRRKNILTFGTNLVVQAEQPDKRNTVIRKELFFSKETSILHFHIELLSRKSPNVSHRTAVLLELFAELSPLNQTRYVLHLFCFGDSNSLCSSDWPGTHNPPAYCIGIMRTHQQTQHRVP